MILSDFDRFGGQHWETAAMRNALAYQGLVAPHTGEPLSEAMCLGVAGGIAAGYSFCPSIPGHDSGSGVSAVGRYRIYITDASYYQGLAKRLGVKTSITETGGAKKASQNLVEALESGRPTVVWCSPLRFGHVEWWAGTCGMYSTLIYGVDEGQGRAYLSDCPAVGLTISLDDLSWIRGRVCSHKNRTLTFDPPKKLSAAALKAAVLAGVRACADDLLKPKLKTYNLPGLLEWSKVIDKAGNKKGWPKVYPAGKLFLPLRDAYESIENAGTGGGLMRPLYAEFLDEAAKITGRSGLAECADVYRQLAEQWSELATTALPNKIKPFKRTRELLDRRRQTYLTKGDKASAQLEKINGELQLLAANVVRDFPLDDAAKTELLGTMSEKLAALHAAESDAAKRLQNAGK